MVRRALVACEESGKVADRIDARPGWEAVSCDLLPSRTRAWPAHWQGDVRELLAEPFDLMIAFPPCTDLAVSGNAQRAVKWADGRTQASLDFARMLFSQKQIPHVAMENPVGLLSTHLRKPDQIVQPWQFGHGEVKATCLWLRGLPPLVATDVVPGREPRVWRMGPGPDRARLRSETYDGIASAMVEQWCEHVETQGSQLDLFAMAEAGPVVAG